MQPTEPSDKSILQARRATRKLGIAAAQRQILLCYDRKRAKCASQKAMRAAYKFLKKRLKSLGLKQQGLLWLTPVYCFDICVGGPICVVEPDGVWYGGCTPEVLERILVEHVLEGRIVTDFAIGVRPCAAESAQPQ